jgi:hypothetical protein
MSEVRFYLIGEEAKVEKLAFYAFVIGFGIFATGFILSELTYPIGADLQPVGLAVGLPASFFLVIRRATGKKGRKISKKEVIFKPDTITLAHRTIALSTVKIVDSELEYEGGIAHGGSVRNRADGTGNRMRLVYKDISEESFCFYIPDAPRLALLRQVLKEAKQRHAFVLIM